MPSRFFTMKERLHFPNDCSHIEVTEDGRYLHHQDSGEVKTNRDLKVPALACLRYVSSGHWVEIDAARNPIVGIDPRDFPVTAADHW